MSSSVPPIQFLRSHDQDECPAVPHALESGVRSVPEKLAEDFSERARGIRIHVRKSVAPIQPVEIYDERGYCVSDRALDDFGDGDDAVDAAQEKILQKLADFKGEDVSEEALLDLIDTMLAADKVAQQKKGQRPR